MKKLTKNPLFYTSLVLAILLGFQTYSLVFSAYTPPAGAPPTAGNVAQPLDTSASPQAKIGDLTIGESALPSLWLQTAGGNAGKIYYDGTRLMARNGSGTPFEIGTGAITKIIAGTNVTISPTNGVGDVTINAAGGAAAVTAPLTLQTGSGGTGIILKKDPTDNRGTNSPMLVFSGFGATVGVAVQKDLGFNMFPVARALSALPCDTTFDSACSGGGGGGGGGGSPDTLTEPIWWMRQEGTAFALHASAANFSDVRNVATFTKGGAVVAKGFFIDQGSTAAHLDPITPGTWCGLSDGIALRWTCGGFDPGGNINSCPSGWQRQVFGKNSFVSGKDWSTCVKQ